MPRTYWAVSVLPTVARITAYCSAADFSCARNRMASESAVSLGAVARSALLEPANMPGIARPSKKSRRFRALLRCGPVAFDLERIMRRTRKFVYKMKVTQRSHKMKVTQRSQCLAKQDMRNLPRLASGEPCRVARSSHPASGYDRLHFAATNVGFGCAP